MKLDPFTAAYVTAALWSSTVDDRPMDSDYSFEDIPDETLSEMVAHCKLFQRKARQLGIDFDRDITNRQAYAISCTPTEYAGHDFWLTRNGHGCGFWDGGWREPAATKLDELSKWFGECDLYIGDDQLIYQM